MTDATFHITKDQIRKPESHVSRAHKGRTPANSNVSAMKVRFIVSPIQYPSLTPS